MKTIVQLILGALLFASCTEEFKSVDPQAFNKKVAERADIETPEELITVYYNYPPNEGKPDLSINSQKLNANEFEITLIHDGQQDDAQQAEKVIMRAVRTNNKWTVREIRRNWKCYSGRGHTSWGIGYCG
jgi:hypothetical protein